MSNFKIILLAFFIFIFGFAVLVFSGIIKLGGSTTSTAGGTVVMWGTIPSTAVEGYINDYARQSDPYKIEYVQNSKDTFYSDFIEALASGTGPDLLLVENDSFLKLRSKLYVIPYTGFPERTFRDTYLDGASLYLSSAGIYVLPVVVDPLVLYYNKDILAHVGFLNPPSTWEEVAKNASLFVMQSKDNTISNTGFPLGEYVNINHFKDILAALFLQAGNNIVTENTQTKTYETLLQQSQAVADGLRFYISFANPVSENYSWNRSLPNSLDMFISGKAGFYIGRASELFSIQSQNPNLNFDVTTLPQPAAAARPVTYGSFVGVSVVKSSTNFTSAYTAALALGGSDFSSYLSKALSLPPANRSLVVAKPDSPYLNVFFSAAANAFSWPDPDPAATDQAFRDMIRNVTSGRETPEQSVYDATKAIQASIRN